MKQAKFVFTATAVLAVVGAAVALNARSNQKTIFTKAGGACTVPSVGVFSTYPAASTVVPLLSYATVSGPCIITTRVSKTANE
ncbi:hypothetical protein SAMN05660909_00295 [Chitinophaga terrae (ex Kim and Jung 2007)]|uniref:Uncharacterized protein n=2 Tax=Chitinophaga terrae (ex Kim and Jung 2007) TaxID=408074 RepID=A0A1H3X8U5_9BACT|nr:hypothetical protein SAMN05660909_00295 [Chitinophaga terrae (ex Kim and Jung 2007)]